MNKLFGIAAIAVAGFLGAVGPSQAEGRAVVVELFTSQGCSSCPPADELLKKMAEYDGLLVLSLHVDYWDYIGWKDTFARRENTTRQRAYARAKGSRMIYTPQMVVGGTDHVVGTRPMEVSDMVMRHMDQDEILPMTLTRKGDMLMVSAPVPTQKHGDLVVQLVRYIPSSTVDIKRGENAGKTIVYTNIVTDWKVVGDWPGAQPLSMEIAAPGDEPAAVIIQKKGPGAILASASVE